MAQGKIEILESKGSLQQKESMFYNSHLEPVMSLRIQSRIFPVKSQSREFKNCDTILSKCLNEMTCI